MLFVASECKITKIIMEIVEYYLTFDVCEIVFIYVLMLRFIMDCWMFKNAICR